MEYRYVKDLAYILLIIAVITLLVFAYNHHNTEQKVLTKSEFAEQEVDSNLLKKAIEIEQGIMQRKEFSFSITKDPLKQDIILPQKIDEIKLRMQQRYNKIRLYGVQKFDDRVLVGIEHKDIENQYAVGQIIEKSDPRVSIKSADPVNQTVVLSNGTKLVVEERMDVFNIPSIKPQSTNDNDISNQNY
ncbi:hypothetical protein JEZ13_01215 [bacterium]|nr:hypothetical protein [bacterium]